MEIGISDLGGLGASSGNTAQRLLNNGMNPECLRPFVDMRTNERGQVLHNPITRLPIIDGYWVNSNGLVQPAANATLRKEEWLAYDTVAIDIQRQSLVGVADVNSRGLIHNIPNGLGTTVLESQTSSDMEEAEMTMTGRSLSKSDVKDYASQFLPLPIIHAGFSVDIRHLESGRRNGRAIDTDAVATRSRKIADFKENLLFNGVSGNFLYSGGNIYGYRTHPSRNQYTISDWSNPAITPLTIYDEASAIKQMLVDQFFHGPFVLYVPTAYSKRLDDDYQSGSSGWNSGNTIRERIMKLTGIADVKVADALNSSSVVMVQMTSDVVRMVHGLPLKTVEWSNNGGFTMQYKILTIEIPQIRADADGSCGVVHGST